MPESPASGDKKDFVILVAVVLGIVVFMFVQFRGTRQHAAVKGDTKPAVTALSDWMGKLKPVKPDTAIDKVAYDRKMLLLAHIDSSQSPRATAVAPMAPAKTPADLLPVPVTKKTPVKRKPQDLWPVKNAPYPNPGAILPFKRIIAYYGNFFAKGMGVLGEYPTDVMLRKLQGEMKSWADADPTTPVLPAIDYIAVSAQGSPGADGKYRARMPGSEIDKAVALADQLHGIVILEVQVGLGDIMTEVRLLEPFLSKPQVHLAIDPEFSMKTGAKPGTKVGTVDAKEMNVVAEYLAKLVKERGLPPKVLIIHRYTQGMVTNATSIKPLPDVQILMDMDGWGFKAKKISTYKSFVYSEPVQFTGFKLFYKNDIKTPGTVMMTPKEVLELTPQPSFIQFQ